MKWLLGIFPPMFVFFPSLSPTIPNYPPGNSHATESKFITRLLCVRVCESNSMECRTILTAYDLAASSCFLFQHNMRGIYRLMVAMTIHLTTPSNGDFEYTEIHAHTHTHTERKMLEQSKQSIEQKRGCYKLDEWANARRKREKRHNRTTKGIICMNYMHCAQPMREVNSIYRIWIFRQYK